MQNKGLKLLALSLNIITTCIGFICLIISHTFDPIFLGTIVIGLIGIVFMCFVIGDFNA
jgi:hypothetical protein